MERPRIERLGEGLVTLVWNNVTAASGDDYGATTTEYQVKYWASSAFNGQTEIRYQLIGNCSLSNCTRIDVTGLRQDIVYCFTVIYCALLHSFNTPHEDHAIELYFIMVFHCWLLR